MLYSLDSSDDPQFRDGERIYIYDAATDEPVEHCQRYDTRTHELTRQVLYRHNLHTVTEIRRCRLVFADREPCDACRATGQYVGFNLVHPCAACGGSGYVHPPEERLDDTSVG